LDEDWQSSARQMGLNHVQFGLSCEGVAANPAARSVIIESLFPPGVAAAELREPGRPALLAATEAVAVATAVSKRVEEFAAGRLCARRALERFGITDFAVRAARDRQPIWPDSMVGSITHTTGFCAAVVGERAHFISLGLDTERADAVKSELWSSVCIAEELTWIDSLPVAARPSAATLIFSAKEACYKCQYPATGERMSFSDLHITLRDWGSAIGSFSVISTRSLSMFRYAAPSGVSAPCLLGAYRFHDEFVSVGMCFPFNGGPHRSIL
jgi:4'-phosphopantetheinyl transferase EntD